MTIQFYQDNAQRFYEDTVNVDVSSIYDRFLKYLPAKGHILDAGCGSGRDSLYLKNAGFNVSAIDASSNMVKLAAELTGLPVQQCYFEDITETNKYDGLWCCASLLHVPETDLPMIFKKLIASLKEGGYWYLSFKFGETQRIKDGRLFTDMNQIRLANLLALFPELKNVEDWVTEDLRANRTEKWLNVILKKVAVA
ncbi:class I SAM-dependent methyltransferase [Vibrio ulleungensis]|uniref:Class I SAM-dependent methyltransferase n=1 Tax=Vibrio ulleungensis TaxID=2807619 RepID=A0ABS2HIR9_9VIBR|nr:class I SAM-dependent methyltransferase [Vibrio ulleungensis]MBM7037430.1 class I SAM-dependent methyltransferase [Vibrio ulleungensis]